MLKTTANTCRDVQITAFKSDGDAYYLYVKEGKISHIVCRREKGLECFYSDDCSFNTQMSIVINILCELENLKSLKRLYNALEAGKFKQEVKSYIDKLIDRYEKALTILKS